MTRLKCTGVLCALLLAAAFPAGAQSAPGPKNYKLTLMQALALARERAPAALAARARIGEARGRLIGASVLLHHNPSLELGGGPRITPRGASPDIDAGVGLSFELGGQRRARMDAAAAGIDHAKAASDETMRRLLRDTALMFLRALHAKEMLGIASETRRLAAEIHRVAQRRHKAGDVGVLDVDLAALALARARVEVQTARAARNRALGSLRVLLGLESGAKLTVHGESLHRRRLTHALLMANITGRSDLRALDAAIRKASAEVRLGEAQAWPDLGIRLGYGREDNADSVLGSLTLTLPLFNRGRGAEATARARGEALGIERRFAEAAARVRIRTLHSTYKLLLRAVDRFERDGLPRIARTDKLARRSYKAGNMPLSGLLVVRRQLIVARTTHANLKLNTALAGVEMEIEAGVLR